MKALPKPPPISVPVLDRAGNMNLPWYLYYEELARLTADNTDTLDEGKASSGIILTAGDELDGGGDLTENRTFDHVGSAVTPGTYGDGSNVGQFTVNAFGHITNASNIPIAGAGSTFLSLTDTPSSFAGAGEYFLKVNVGESAVEFVMVTIPASFIDLDDVPTSYSGEGGNLLAANGAETGLEFITNDFINELTGDVTASGPGSAAATIANNAVSFAKFVAASAESKLIGRGEGSGAGNFEEITLGTGLSMTGTTLNASAGGSISFLDLTDTPSDYTGFGEYILAINVAETGIEFVLNTGGVASFTDLDDVPTSYSGEGGRILAANSGETALEFIDYPNILDIGISVGGTIRTSQIVAYAMIPAGGYFLPAGLSGSYAYALVPPVTAANTVIFIIEESSSTIGTVTFTNGSNVGVFSFTSDNTFAAGQSLNLRSPSNIDGMQDISIVFHGIEP